MDSITDLEEQIKADKDNLQAKKLILKAIKRQNKPPFMENKFGKACLKTMRFVTNPFAAAHMNVSMRLEAPDLYQATKLQKRAEKLLKSSEDINRLEHEKTANKVCLHAANLVMAIEEFLESNQFFKHDMDQYVSKLKTEINRLRPPKDPIKEQEIIQLVDNLVEQGLAK